MLLIRSGAPHVAKDRIAHDDRRIYPDAVRRKVNYFLRRFDAAFISIAGKAGHHLQNEVKAGGFYVPLDPDWKPEKWGEFILQNFFELFEIMLSYLSNTMSFLRVGAFVLVHAGMMMAVFAIGNMFHAFGFTVAVIIGNALVMVMEALLVAIQVMRLEFYEMFSRYYNGDGRSFRPLSLAADTKPGK